MKHRSVDLSHYVRNIDHMVNQEKFQLTWGQIKERLPAVVMRRLKGKTDHLQDSLVCVEGTVVKLDQIPLFNDSIVNRKIHQLIMERYIAWLQTRMCGLRIRTDAVLDRTPSFEEFDTFHYVEITYDDILCYIQTHQKSCDDTWSKMVAEDAEKRLDVVAYRWYFTLGWVSGAMVDAEAGLGSEADGFGVRRYEFAKAHAPDFLRCYVRANASDFVGRVKSSREKEVPQDRPESAVDVNDTSFFDWTMKDPNGYGRIIPDPEISEKKSSEIILTFYQLAVVMHSISETDYKFVLECCNKYGADVEAVGIGDHITSTLFSMESIDFQYMIPMVANNREAIRKAVECQPDPSLIEEINRDLCELKKMPKSSPTEIIAYVMRDSDGALVPVYRAPE